MLRPEGTKNTKFHMVWLSTKPFDYTLILLLCEPVKLINLFHRHSIITVAVMLPKIDIKKRISTRKAKDCTFKTN